MTMPFHIRPLHLRDIIAPHNSYGTQKIYVNTSSCDLGDPCCGDRESVTTL